MRLKFALLADYAAMMEHGKLLLVGEFENVWSPVVPFQRGPFYLVGRFEAHVSEGTEHTLRIGMYDADGKEVAILLPDAPLRFTPGGPGLPLRAQFIAQLAPQFPAYGEYGLHITVDGRTEEIVKVNAIRPPKAHGQA